jgi:hypothetical protein
VVAFINNFWNLNREYTKRSVMATFAFVSLDQLTLKKCKVVRDYDFHTKIKNFKNIINIS